METLQLGSTGPNVMLLQSTLKKIGFFTSEIDGEFGPLTQTAVINFQKNNFLEADGIVGINTWNALRPYIFGYEFYKIQSEDTIYSIANKFNTSVNAILTANPNINTSNLLIGATIIIPINSIVPTDINYTSQILEMNIGSFKAVYPFLDIGTIGTSVLGTNLYYIKFGNGPKEVFYNASTHAK